MSIPREVYSTFCNNLYDIRIWRSSDICICANVKDSIHTEHRISLLLKEKLYITLGKNRKQQDPNFGVLFLAQSSPIYNLKPRLPLRVCLLKEAELGFEEMLPPCGRLTQKQLENLLRGQYSKGPLGCKIPSSKFSVSILKEIFTKGKVSSRQYEKASTTDTIFLKITWNDVQSHKFLETCKSEGITFWCSEWPSSKCLQTINARVGVEKMGSSYNAK